MTNRLYYGWIVVAIAFVVLLVGAAIRAAPGVMMVPLELEFGWDRTIVSLSLSINLILYGLFGPFAAAMMNRFGVKQVTLAALLLLTTSTFLTKWMQEPWQVYLLWGLMVGIGSGCTTALSTMVSNEWFVRRRGFVVGILTASGATGQILFLPLLASVISRDGWRTATWILAFISIIAILLVFLLMKNKPKDIGLLPYGVTEPMSETITKRQNPFTAAVHSLKQASRSWDFWLLAGSFFICGLSTNGLIGAHFIPLCIEHGIPEVTAASMLAAIGIFDVAGTLFSGWLSDRYNNRWLLFWYYGLRGISLMFLPFVLSSSQVGLWMFIVFYGLDWVATVPPTVRLTTDIFGKEKAGILFGWIMAAHQLGAATAAYGGGLTYSLLSSYQLSFITAGLFCLLASGIVIRIGKTAREKRAVLAEESIKG
jgi:MFS family permease